MVESMTALRRRRISSLLIPAAGTYHPNAVGGSVVTTRYNMNTSGQGTTFASDEDALIYGWHIGKDISVVNPTMTIETLAGDPIIVISGLADSITGDVDLPRPLYIEGGFRLTSSAAMIFSIVWSKWSDGALV